MRTPPLTGTIAGGPATSSTHNGNQGPSLPRIGFRCKQHRGAGRDNTMTKSVDSPWRILPANRILRNSRSRRRDSGRVRPQRQPDPPRNHPPGPRLAQTRRAGPALRLHRHGARVGGAVTGRKAIFLFSDGLDELSLASQEMVIDAARDHPAPARWTSAATSAPTAYAAARATTTMGRRGGHR